MFHIPRRFAVLFAMLCTVGLTTVAGLPATASSHWFPEWGRAAVHQAQPVPQVIDLRYGRHTDYDRVIVDLENGMSAYTVRYVHRLRYAASGEPVDLKGRRFLEITLTPASAHNGLGRSTYVGPRLRRLSWPSLRGLAFTGDFEGVVSFGVGVDRKVPFRVFTLENPNRLIVDLRH